MGIGISGAVFALAIALRSTLCLIIKHAPAAAIFMNLSHLIL